jgi:hypothetical protein
MKLTNQEIYGLNQLLESIEDISSTFKFNYAMKRNKDRFRSALRSQPLYTPPQTDEYKNFVSYFKELIKDKKLNSPKDYENLFMEELQKEEFTEAFKQRNELYTQWEKNTQQWASKVVEIPIYTIPVETFPDGLTSAQFDTIYDYFASDKIEDETEENEIEEDKQ